jgi:predicted transcriptional regulator
MSYTYVLLQVKELLDRNLNAYEIAHRLHIDISIVDQAIQILTT